jgi:CDGSH iron-sulfur domain-containing protein 3
MTKATIAGREPIVIKVEAGKEYWWCACGHSKSQPFCDGSHKAEGTFSPVAWTAPKSGTKYFCACKQTGNAPFCDGTHGTL